MASTRKSSDYDDHGSEPTDLPAEKTRVDSITIDKLESLRARTDAAAPGAPSASGTLSALQSLSLSKTDAPASARSSARRSGGGWLPWLLFSLVSLAFVAVLVAPRFSPRFAGLVPLTAPGSAQASGASSAQPIRVEVLRPTTSGGQVLHASGYVAARVPITVGSQIPGQVTKVLVVEGTKVKNGQLLAQLDDSQPRAQLTLAQAKRRDAERTLARVKSLLSVQGATPADYDRARGQAEIARAEMEPILQRIEQSKVRAPIEGTILEEIAHPGEVITGSAGVVKMADLTKLVAEIDVNEADLPSVKVGQTVEVVCDAAPDSPQKGTVREIGEQADRAKGTVIVKVWMQVADHSLRPGMIVKASFMPEGQKSHLLIPADALVQGSVWVVGADGTVSRQPVVTQKAGPSTVEVLSGLGGGERIVVAGAHSVALGQKVQ